MAKRKKKDTKPARAAAVEPADMEPAAVPALENEPIDAGTWRGHPNYGCPWCDHASLDEAAVRHHMRQHVLVDRA